MEIITRVPEDILKHTLKFYPKTWSNSCKVMHQFLNEFKQFKKLYLDRYYGCWSEPFESPVESFLTTNMTNDRNLFRRALYNRLLTNAGFNELNYGIVVIPQELLWRDRVLYGTKCMEIEYKRLTKVVNGVPIYPNIKFPLNPCNDF